MHKRFEKIKAHVFQKLKNELPTYLTYHSLEHTKYVLDRAIFIASKENVSKHDMLLLKTAVLYHDIGYTKSHKEHEAVGCEIAREELPDFNYSKEEIDVICGMIMATKIPQEPKTLLEEIIADADLEYLGTKHFDTVSEFLYKELKHFRPDLTRDEWNSLQIQFMENHQYYTKFCRHYKAPRKQKHIEELKSKIK